MKTLLKGFTLIELVLVIAILGVLAVAALPQLFGISLTSARTNSMKATAAAVQAAVWIYASVQISQGLPPSYPADLDSVTGSAAPGTPASGLTPLFGNVLQNGVNAQWIKLASGTCYAFDEDGSGTVSAPDIYYQYSSVSGTFSQVTTCT